MLYKLKIFHSGQLIGELDLLESQSYEFGRDESSHIKLPALKGISRKHFKVYFDESYWVIELITKFGEIRIASESANSFALEETTTMYIGPFEVCFEAQEEKEDSVVEDKQVSIAEEVKQESTLSSDEDSDNKTLALNLNEISEDNNDATCLVSPSTSTFLVVNYNNQKKDIFVLEGESWVAGRDPNCDIFLNDDHISRKHFELSKINNEFKIKDLNSSNGVRINGQKIPPNQYTTIALNELIIIKRIQLTIEVRDKNYKSHLQNISNTMMEVKTTQAAYNQPMNMGHHANSIPMGMENQPAALRIDDEPKAKKNYVQLLLIALVPLLLFGLLLKDDSKPKSEKSLASTDKNKNGSMSQLSAAQKSLLKDSLVLAKSQYNREQFSLCLAELSKIHDIIPSYQDSKKLQNFCENGLELSRAQENKKLIERERKLTEQKVRDVISQCSTRVNTFNTMDELNSCLSEAIELSPEDIEIEQLREVINQREYKKQHAASQKAEYQNKVNAGIKLYKVAEKTHKKGKLTKAITEYEYFINKNYPDPKKFKNKAKRNLASIRSQLTVKIKKSLDICKNQTASSNYKAAFDACKKALQEDPSNSAALEMRGDLLLKLGREMKSKFDNASIEENYGNVEAAKELWKQILSIDFPKGSRFYKKAKNKLKKYEVLN
ncbi:MAG: FHA domain-containing protein [Bdellovibrionaceae bacterium]|nr:FHA domain-containing protein [Pseudobdellovibrionaceae bacterium]